MLKDGHTILKPLANQEFIFYELLKKQPAEVQAFFPKCFGRRTRQDETGQTNSTFSLIYLCAEAQLLSFLSLGGVTFAAFLDVNCLFAYVIQITLSWRI